MRITGLRARDIRFPTSQTLDGSDALNVGDYSATYVTLETDGEAGGYGLTFTNGRGNRIGVASALALAPLVTGLTLEEITGDFRSFYRRLTQDPQLRWIGPEKGIVHMATGAVLNAVWDLWAPPGKKADMEASRRSQSPPAGLRDRFLLDHGCPDAGGSNRHPRGQRGNAVHARAGDLRERVSGLYDLDGLARLLRRKGSTAVPGGHCLRLDVFQDEGRARPGNEHTTRGARARRDRR